MPGGKHEQPQAECVEQHGDILPAFPSTGRKLSLSFSPKLAPILYHLSISNTFIESLHFILQCFKKEKKKPLLWQPGPYFVLHIRHGGSNPEAPSGPRGSGQTAGARPVPFPAGSLRPLQRGWLSKQMSNQRVDEGHEPLLQAALPPPHPQHPPAWPSGPRNDLGPREPRCLSSPASPSRQHAIPGTF